MTCLQLSTLSIGALRNRLSKSTCRSDISQAHAQLSPPFMVSRGMRINRLTPPFPSNFVEENIPEKALSDLLDSGLELQARISPFCTSVQANQSISNRLAIEEFLYDMSLAPSNSKVLPQAWYHVASAFAPCIAPSNIYATFA